MLRFWLNRDLSEGLHTFFSTYNGVEIVEVSYEESGERRIVPGPSLRDIEAMQRYIQEQFPDGWLIDDDGRILTSRPGGGPVEEEDAVEDEPMTNKRLNELLCW